MNKLGSGIQIVFPAEGGENSSAERCANKLVLLAVNAKYVHSSLSVWALASGMAQFCRANVQTVVVETTINQSVGTIVAKAAQHEPDIIGISTYIWNAAMLPQIIGGLRALLPKVTIILGGPEAAYNAQHWLQNGANYVLRGEGERSLPALIDALEIDTGLEGVSGLCYLQQGKLRENAIEILRDTPPNPYTDEWQKALAGRIAYVETSRGCPFSCAFCLSGQDETRFLPLEYAKRQLLRLSKSGAVTIKLVDRTNTNSSLHPPAEGGEMLQKPASVPTRLQTAMRTIKLVDRTFNCNAGRAYDLFEYVIGMDTDCCFHFEVAADLFDERTLCLLQTAPKGRIQLEAGLQSFYEPTLKAVSRKTNLQKVVANINRLVSFGNIHVHVDLIAGLPFESFARFQNSFNSAYALGAHQLQLGFLKLLHGSVLRSKAEEYGIRFNHQPPYEIIDNAWISEKELDILHKTEDALEHVYNSGRFLQAVKYVLDVTGMPAFDFYSKIGQSVPHSGMPLAKYAEMLYVYFCGLAGVDKDILRQHMVCSLLAGAKGENLPPVLRAKDARHAQVAKAAQQYFGHAVPRRNIAVLQTSNKGVFVGYEQDPVTGLFKLYYIDL